MSRALTTVTHPLGRRLLAARADVPDGAAYRRVAAAHIAATCAALLVVAVDWHGLPEGDIFVAAGIAVTAGLLRIANVGRPLARSTLVLDAAGMAVVLAGTGAPSSPFLFFAVAGAWWAAHITTSRHSGVIYAAGFFVVYALLIVPVATMTGSFVLVLEDVTTVGLVGVLADWFVRVDRRALELSEALGQAPSGIESLTVRKAVARSLGSSDVPVDVVLTAVRCGLTVPQAELLAYLVLGLTNQEVADAMNMSVATVRYRLTRLYRVLGVTSRREAAERARQLGVESLPPAA